MNLSKIKQKYKQILQQNQPQQTQSDQQWQLAYSRMKNNRRKHILTQSNYVNISNNGLGLGLRRSSLSVKNQTDEEKYVRVKEKLAQALVNLNKKDKEIQQVKLQNIKGKQQIKILQETISSLKSQIMQNQQKLIEQKVAFSCIEKNMETISKNIQSEKMDKQLLQRQIEYYQGQIQSFKKQGQNKDHKMQELKKQLKQIDNLKCSNARLREDATRLRQLLQETQKYRMFATKIQYKNYIGKQCKQHECWISQDIVHDVQTFIRKQHQVLNISFPKQFTNNLIKFISKNIQITKSAVQRKARKLYNSKLKDNQRKQNHSMNMMQIRQQQMKKSNIGSSLMKSRRNTHNLNDSKLWSQSFLYGSLDKSHISHCINLNNTQANLNKNKQICLEILGQFRKGIVQLIQSKQVKKKKLIKLVDWVIQGVMSLFSKQKCVTNGDFRLETQEIKITL